MTTLITQGESNNTTFVFPGSQLIPSHLIPCWGHRLVHDTSDDNEENNHEHVSQVEQQLGNAEQWFYANTTSNKDVKEHHSSTELRYHVELGGNVGEAIAAERLDDTSI